MEQIHGGEDFGVHLIGVGDPTSQEEGANDKRRDERPQGPGAENVCVGDDVGDYQSRHQTDDKQRQAEEQAENYTFDYSQDFGHNV